MRSLEELKSKLLNRKSLGIPFLLILFILFHLFLISQTFFIDTGGDIHSTITGYGDIPLHLTQITKFAFEKSFNLQEPIFYGHKLDYPFLINLISGLFLRVTKDFSFSVLFPVFVFAAINIILIYIVYKKLLKNGRLAYLAMVTFFLGSGMGGLEYLRKAFENKFTPLQFINYLIQNHVTTVVKLDAVFPNQSIDYGAPLSLVLLHQRAFFLGLFGFLIFLLTLLLSEHSNSKKLLLASGIFLGLLPLMHTHSFIAGCVTIFAFMIIALFKKNPGYAKKIFLIGLIGFCISIPQLIYLFDLTFIGNSSSFIAYRLGWMVPPTIGSIVYPPNQTSTVFSYYFLQFLWNNFGIILPAFISCLVLLLASRKKILNDNFIKIFSFALSGLLLFALVQLVRLQPWDFDDNKILVYFQFFAIPIIFLFLKEIFSKRKLLGITLGTIFIILALFSGVIDMIPRVGTPFNSLPVIFDVNARQTADFIRKNIPENDLILTGTSHRDPVDSLAGRPVYLGYPGWLWSRGINYSDRETQVTSFYQTPSKDYQFIKDYKIKYVLLSDQDISDFKTSKILFDRAFKVIYSNPEFTLYTF